MLHQESLSEYKRLLSLSNLIKEPLAKKSTCLIERGITSHLNKMTI